MRQMEDIEKARNADDDARVKQIRELQMRWEEEKGNVLQMRQTLHA